MIVPGNPDELIVYIPSYVHDNDTNRLVLTYTTIDIASIINNRINQVYHIHDNNSVINDMNKIKHEHTSLFISLLSIVLHGDRGIIWIYKRFYEYLYNETNHQYTEYELSHDSILKDDIKMSFRYICNKFFNHISNKINENTLIEQYYNQKKQLLLVRGDDDIYELGDSISGNDKDEHYKQYPIFLNLCRCVRHSSDKKSSSGKRRSRKHDNDDDNEAIQVHDTSKEVDDDNEAIQVHGTSKEVDDDNEAIQVHCTSKEVDDDNEAIQVHCTSKEVVDDDNEAIQVHGTSKEVVDDDNEAIQVHGISKEVDDDDDKEASLGHHDRNDNHLKYESKEAIQYSDTKSKRAQFTFYILCQMIESELKDYVNSFTTYRQYVRMLPMIGIAVNIVIKMLSFNVGHVITSVGLSAWYLTVWKMVSLTNIITSFLLLLSSSSSSIAFYVVHWGYGQINFFFFLILIMSSVSMFLRTLVILLIH